MRGSPLIQAFGILISLLLLGVVGQRFIAADGNDPSPSSGASTQDKTTATSNTEQTVIEAEIELTFSTPPLSCTLKYLTENHPTPKEVTIFQINHISENPLYQNVSIPSHALTTYWLDVTWPNDPPENAQHFVSLTLSPNQGDPKQFSFHSTTENLNETFDYSTTPDHANHVHE
jgi:hypothetical protein